MVSQQPAICVVERMRSTTDGALWMIGVTRSAGGCDRITRRQHFV
jgi:hypothetical protein